MKRIFAAAVVAIGALVGCSSSDGREQAASSTTTTTSPPPRLPGVEGRFLSLAGENLYDAGLYELRLWPVRLDPLTEVRRVSSIGACDTRVVVAAAQAEVGYNDHLQLFSGGRFSPVENLGSPHAFLPALARDCRMLYLDLSGPGGGAGDARIHLWNPSDGSDTVIASYPGLGRASWGPDGQVAFVERTRSVQGTEQHDLAVHIITPKTGARRSFPPPTPGLTDLFWGGANWMAFGRSPENSTIFLQPDTGERHDLDGWVPRAWSPDGKRLLVAAGGDHRRLGVVELPDFSTVKPLGEAPFPVHDTVWLPAGSDPVGAITPS